jgi:hypothetical protein
MEREPILLYFGCPLTGKSDEYRDEIRRFKLLAKRRFPGIDILEFCGMNEGTPADVYEKDINQGVAKSHGVLAIWDDISSGLGFEEGMGIGRFFKPFLNVSPRGAKISRLIQGIEPHHNYCRAAEYDDKSTDLLETIGLWLKDLPMLVVLAHEARRQHFLKEKAYFEPLSR